MKSRALLSTAAGYAADYLEQLDERSVFPGAEAVASLTDFERPLAQRGAPASEVLEELNRLGAPATVASAGGRYFGFVIGGALPATLAASWLASAWDQNAGAQVMSPVAARLEAVASDWLLSVLGLPSGCGVGFVTGATMANFVALAAARHHLLAKLGWDVESRGLFGAPELQVVVGQQVHVSLLKALALLGMGKDRVVKIPVDGQGRMRADALPALSEQTLVCIQAGNVNTGAFDPAAEVCARAHEFGAWVHVDGAFGLWAAAAPGRSHLADGVALADSWATDAHKWLNVPYDCGLVFCRDAALVPPAMLVSADYLITGEQREPYAFTPEMSRRARGIEVWAALKSLGRDGLADLVERNCRQAAHFAGALAGAGFEILNDVVLNQVLVSFGTDAVTEAVISAIQRDGTCWCGGTRWHGRAAMRISVSGWATEDTDVESSIAAMIRIAEHVRGEREDK